MNILNVPGPAFLQLYVALLAVCIVAALALRAMLRSPGDALTPGQTPGLHPHEVAYLSGGTNRVIDTAIALLVHRGSLNVNKTSRLLVSAGAPPEDLTPLEQNIIHAVMTHSGRVPSVRRSVRNVAAAVAGRVERLGLVLTPAQRVYVRLLPPLFLLALLALGIAKINTGLGRHRPIGYLAILTTFTLFIGMGFVTVGSFRTRRGTKLLGTLQRRNNALQTTAGRAPPSLAGEDLSLACALYGAGVFAYGPMADLKRTLIAEPASSFHVGFSGCGSSSSGSGCGGGGGGCGGGGGGCGGCGGGGS
jgi:uncharacterized protein (TIGR04222 family)